MLLTWLAVEKREKLLTTKEVAEVFNVTRHAVAKWIREGRIRAVKLPGGQYRVPESEVERIWRQLKATESR
ncbi:MAG: helix-turn-helix domain-containing protein [Candidatus Bathyarchaeia archaeon]